MAERAPVVIVGGGPAGFSAASEYRACGGTLPVVLLCAESLPPYRRPPLTKEFLRGRTTLTELLMEGAGWYETNGIEVRLGCVAGVHVIRTVRDSSELAAAHAGTRVAVVGSGFIGCEAAASLALRGAQVSVVTPEDGPQAERLGPDVGRRLEAWLHEAGVEILAGRSLTAIEEGPGGLLLSLDDGELTCDHVLLAVGVQPRIAIAEEAGVPTEDGAILADASMRTQTPGVWCAGDVALALNPSAGRRLRVEHWGEALRQGAIAGRVLAGGEAAWDDVPGFWSTIGHRTLKQAAWGDGWDTVALDSDPEGFTAWYGRDGRIVGVLTHERDHDYETGRQKVRDGEHWPFT